MSAPERISILEIDQKLAKQAWQKLQENTISDQTLDHPKFTFYCVKNTQSSIRQPHFDINVFPPRSDPQKKDNQLVDLCLVKKRNNVIEVLQDVDLEEQTSLTPQEINAYLRQIAASVRRD